MLIKKDQILRIKYLMIMMKLLLNIFFKRFDMQDNQKNWINHNQKIFVWIKY
jgi:hypothetical protein